MFLYDPLLSALSVPVTQRVSDFIAAFVAPPLQSPAHLAAAGGQLELNLNVPTVIRSHDPCSFILIGH